MTTSWEWDSPWPARDDEVEPLLTHLRKLQDVEALGEADHVGVHARHRHALRPALGLLTDDGAVKPRSEVFRVAPRLESRARQRRLRYRGTPS